ncbi:MAG: hypothetical protein JSS07_02615 [Proteobacteria bacterium]|nr:hypothetical protein [Pseudomonadota bacterium]
MFQVWIGLGGFLVGTIPIWFMKSKNGKMIGFIVALAFGVVCFGISPYFYSTYLGWQFEHEIKKQALFALISRHYPTEYSDYIKTAKQHLKKDQPTLIANDSAQLVNKIFYQSLGQASDDYVVLYLKATLDLYHYLNSQDPRAVVKLENGSDKIEYDLNALYQNQDFQNKLALLLDTKRFVIEAASQSKTPLNEKQAAPLLQGVLTDLGNKFGEGLVRSTFTDNQIPANTAAQIIIEFYTHILGTGKENAGNIMRYIAYLKAKSQA